MLRLYRRHRRTCVTTSQKYRRCSCPIYVEGIIGRNYIKKSMKTTTWDEAQRKVRRIESKGFIDEEKSPATIATAFSQYISDCKSRNLSPSSIKKITNITKKRFGSFCQHKGLVYLEQITTNHLLSFRGEWKDAPISAIKNLERLKTFFKFCLHQKWIRENPSEGLKPPKDRRCPTMPFTQDEMISILAACDQFKDPNHKPGGNSSKRIKSFVLLLRYSGLRIGDALKVGPSSFQKNRLFLHTQKTGTVVFVPVPEFVIKSFEAFTHSSPNYYFWTGKGKLETRIGNMSRALALVFKKAEIFKGHAHRFRDTFAVELLQAGVPIETVSILLGHSDIRITQKSYSPWTRGRQLILESAVEKAWGLHTESTPAQLPTTVHESFSSADEESQSLPVPIEKVM